MRLALSYLLICPFAVTLARPALAEAPVKIGQFASLTGPEAGFGQTARQGAVLAVDEINASGGVLGRPLELVVVDTRTVPGEAATAVKKLIARDKVVAVIASTSSPACREAAPLCQNAHIPMIATTATDAAVTERGNCIFRVCFIDPFQGAVLAKFAEDTLKARRIAILTSVNSSYSIGLTKVFKEQFEAAGGVIVSELKYAEGDRYFRAQLTAIAALRPEALLIPGYYTDVALICRQARELEITCPIFGGDGWEAPQLLELGGPALEGTYYVTHFSSATDSPRVRTFVRNYAARWSGESPDGSAALTYDAVRLIADAIRRAQTTDPSALRAAIAQTHDFPGPTGPTTLDARRNAVKPAVVIQVSSGRLVYLKTVTP